MAIALVTHGSGPATPGANGGASGSLDTSTANFLVLCIAYYTGGGSSSVAVSDSKLNSWTHLTDYSQASDLTRFTIYYCTPTTVGSSHTFTVSNTAIYVGFTIFAFSGMAAASVFQSGTDHGATNSGVLGIQPGSCSPTGNTLFITGLSFGAAGTITINGSFSSPTDQMNYSAGVNVGCAGSYLIQNPGSAQNPNWSNNNASSMTAGIAAFTGAVGVAAGRTGRPSIAVQRSAFY